MSKFPKREAPPTTAPSSSELQDKTYVLSIIEFIVLAYDVVVRIVVVQSTVKLYAYSLSLSLQFSLTKRGLSNWQASEIRLFLSVVSSLEEQASTKPFVSFAAIEGLDFKITDERDVQQYIVQVSEKLQDCRGQCAARVSYCSSVT